MRTLIIIPYFNGNIEWINYFIESCRHNPQFNWLLYGSFDPDTKAPGNVKIHKADLADFNCMASKKLGIRIDIKYPYKLCDFRPAFGCIFNDYLSEYAYWGYSDIDLIYGDLSRFMNTSLLEQNDIISARDDYFPGHFVLYKNTQEINNLYKRIFSYKSIFRDVNRHYAIDERSNLIGKLLCGNEPRTLKRRVKYQVLKRLPLPNDINDVLNKLISTRKIKAHKFSSVIRSDLYYLKQNINEWEVLWENGSLLDLFSNKELMYFHFLSSKNQVNFHINSPDTKNRFTISAHGINPCTDNVTAKGNL